MLGRHVKRSRCVAALAVVVALVAAGPAAAKPTKVLTVCPLTCKYRTPQKAVNAAPAGAKVVIRPGTYVGGIVIKGHTKDNLTIAGAGTSPRSTILEGKGAKGVPAQNGIYVDGANNVTMTNLWARNFVGNGFFVNGVHGYLMKNLVASFNRAYGLYAYRSIGGRMTQDVAYGHGDSGYYVGGTPPQAKPEPTLIDHVKSYENVLGYSGTNCRYVTIRNSEFFNNGAGVVPNTLASEPDAPADTNTITENLIFWNNFDYYRADSPVKPLPSAAGQFNYPTAVGVILFGVHNTTVRDNVIFGNFKWGVATFEDPTYAPATSVGNKVMYNLMGAAENDTNGADFFTDGNGPGNCWENNSAGATFDQGAEPQSVLYPTCSAGTPETADPAQEAKLASYATQTTGQESSWSKHPHPARPGVKPIDGQPTT